MINSFYHLEEISSVIENAMAVGNGKAVASATKIIDDAFVIIPKNKLPIINFGTLDEAFAGEQRARTTNLTEKVLDGNFENMRELGLQYLVMADYVENKKAKEQEDSAKRNRFAVFQELFPDAAESGIEEFKWSSLTKFERTVIDKMVLMQMEIDEAKKKR